MGLALQAKPILIDSFRLTTGINPLIGVLDGDADARKAHDAQPSVETDFLLIVLQAAAHCFPSHVLHSSGLFVSRSTAKVSIQKPSGALTGVYRLSVLQRFIL